MLSLVSTSIRSIHYFLSFPLIFLKIISPNNVEEMVATFTTSVNISAVDWAHSNGFVLVEIVFSKISCVLVQTSSYALKRIF